MHSDLTARATPGVRGLSPYQPGKPVEELERELGIRDIVKLASNENPLGPSARALAAAQAALADFTRYPDGSGFRLKRALAERLGVTPAQITLGNGSNDVLELLARVFVNPGEGVVFSQYAFAVYPIATQAVGGVAQVAPARDWGHDPEALLAQIDERTKLIYIANPNNPTGTWLDRRAVSELLARVPRELVVVLDEAYTEYVSDPDFPDGIALLADHPNLVVTRTFSKAWGLAGLRVGYAVSSPEVADLLNRVRQPFNVNSVALAAAEAVLEDDDYLACGVEVNRAGMAQLTEGFRALELEWIPSAGNFVCVDLGMDAGPVNQALLREGVIVRPVANYGMPNHLRISVGLEQENARCLVALKKVLDR